METKWVLLELLSDFRYKSENTPFFFPILLSFSLFLFCMFEKKKLKRQEIMSGRDKRCWCRTDMKLGESRPRVLDHCHPKVEHCRQGQTHMSHFPLLKKRLLVFLIKPMATMANHLISKSLNLTINLTYTLT